MKNEYVRQNLYDIIWSALTGKINLIQVIIGPRQIGKTTLALQVYDEWKGPKLYQSADQPGSPPQQWLISQWIQARELAKRTNKQTLLILDEVQKIDQWSEIVKKLFDEDKRQLQKVRILLLGSSSLLVQKGLTESLTGRFELHQHFQWSFSECRDAFGVNLNQYIYFGGYPGGLVFKNDQTRWSGFIRNSLIETVLAKDVLLMQPIAKPALLRQTFTIAVNLPAQIISYQKILGTLQDAGNTTTIASYLKLLANAFLIQPLDKFSGSIIKTKGSAPKIIILDNALISALSGKSYKELSQDKTLWGRMIDNATGAAIYREMATRGGQLFYWRDRQNEVDFIIQLGLRIISIEVKSSAIKQAPLSMKIFQKKYSQVENVIISNSKTQVIDGIKNINLRDFFTKPELIFDL